MKSIGVIKQVAALPNMSITDLKKMWKDLHQTASPPFNRVFLEKRLAYRIQELAHSGVLEKTEKRMEQMANEEDENIRMPVEQLLSGTKLIRAWKGLEHCCTVLDDGFEYQGRMFKSLSAVANFITGTKWNGLVFFGLKKQGDKT